MSQKIPIKEVKKMNKEVEEALFWGLEPEEIDETPEGEIVVADNFSTGEEIFTTNLRR